MTNHITDIPLGKAALIAGLGLLIMTLFAIFALSFIFQKLIVSEDATTTVSNIMANQLLFRAGICSFLIVIICDILVAWALYILLKPVNNSLSLLAAWFRLVYSVVFAVALGNYLDIFQLLGQTGNSAVIESNQLYTQVMLSINAFNDEWALGYIFFGLHLAFLGYLVVKSGYITRILGILIFIAGLSYLIDYFGKFLFPDLGISLSPIFGWGELLFMFWLLLKGSKLPEIKKGA